MSAPSSRIAVVVILALLIAAGTWASGWIAVPLVAIAAGAILARWPSVPALAAAGATLGWGLLMLAAVASRSASTLARQLGEILSVHWVVVVAVTLLFPALLAWSAARVTQVLVQALPRRHNGVRVGSE